MLRALDVDMFALFLVRSEVFIHSQSIIFIISATRITICVTQIVAQFIKEHFLLM